MRDKKKGEEKGEKLEAKDSEKQVEVDAKQVEAEVKKPKQVWIEEEGVYICQKCKRKSYPLNTFLHEKYGWLCQPCYADNREKSTDLMDV